ncbi:ATP-binding cassette domain-containing protein [Pigmentiphaga sp. H8]|uniref:dipeptide/oligopeptide/nickel ABC transporter permease/ATP-binding protein n=1 Tax=unclassified Pigmentiphaga TaxID=2626614 RepID=UPI000F59C0F0|nr:dipeptide/oligopeptide/nickel ABC transporter permease/ATP-binding protein [Pigmentiphaga sp. H8]AZG06676.1 ATP-binding cassette domain-containing protein [Pigmentiphaga sp. H8]
MDQSENAGRMMAAMVRLPRWLGLDVASRRLVPPGLRWPVLLFAFLIACALIGPWLAPHDPDAQDLLASLAGPSSGHWLGTDEQGRDVLSRLLYGLRVDLLAALLAVGCGAALGVPAGTLIGFVGGRFDRFCMWLVNAALSLPPIVLILAVVAVLGRGLYGSMVALGLVLSLAFIRLVRGQVLMLRRAPHVQAARLGGASRLRLLVFHVLPGVYPAIVIQVGLFLPVALLVEASLSYLGLSVQPPQSSLGSMLQAAQSASLTAPWQVLPPGIALVVVALVLNALADAVSDRLRPRTMAGGLLESARGRGRPARPAQDEEQIPLRVEGLRVMVADPATGPRLAVRDVDLRVDQGEIVAIVGESGSGKSLTAMSLLGLMPAGAHVAGGSVLLAGRQMVGAGAAQLRQARAHEIGVIFQDPHSCLNPVHTLGSQLIEPMVRLKGWPRAEARARALALLAEVGVTEPARRLDQYPHELSGGIAQRVMIAMALSREPRLLVADEATSALDTTVQAQVLELLARLRRERRLSILLITHSMGVVSHVADRVVVMYGGEVVETGPVGQVVHRPAHPYTRALLEAVPRNTARRGELAGLPGNVPRPGAEFPGCRFAPRCPRVAAACTEHPVALLASGAGLARCVRISGEAA